MKRVNSNLLSSYLNSRFELTHSFWLRCCLLFLVTVSMVSEVWAASYQYTYYVVNLKGEIATQAKATQEAGSAPVIPDVIKSSLLADGTAGTYSYYTLDQFDVASNIYTLHESPTALAALPSAATNIYVKYTYNNASSSIDLSGNTIYYIKDQDKNDPTKVHYMTFNKKWTSADWRTDGSTNADDNFGDNDKERQWVYEGNDPYKIYIRNVYRRDAGADSYVRSELAKGKFEDNNNVRYGGLNTDKLFNTFFFDKDNHIVAANNVYKWQNNTNKYIYYAKENASNYGDIGGRFLVTGTARLNLTTLNIVKSTVTDATIHLVNQTTGKETFSFDSFIDTDDPKPSAGVLARLIRPGVTLLTTYYKEVELTNPIDWTQNVTDIYIPYTVDAATLSNTYHITFSTEEDPVWFSMVCTRNGGKQMVYNSSTNEINSSQGVLTAKAEAITGQYAFIGDPYSFRVITKSADGQYAYVDTGDNSKVRFSDTPEEWALVKGTDDVAGAFQIFRRDDFLSTYRAFWDAYNGGNQIRMTAQTSGTDDIHANRNITATPTPKYNYTYNIVDNNGRIAIKYTVSQYASTRLDGAHGHEALPEAIYSPYLEGETLTFYNNSDLATAHIITTTPASDANIYVRYTTKLLSTRSLSLDGNSNLSVKVGSKYVKYENSAIGFEDGLPARGSEGYEEALRKFVWKVVNSDPYDVSIRKAFEGDYYLPTNNGTDIHYILMKGSDPNNGQQVELILASGGDISPLATTPVTSLSLNYDGSSLTNTATNKGAAAQQVVFADASTTIYYRIIDKQGKIVVEYEQKDATGTPNLSDTWKSPLVSTYYYWKRSNFIEAGGTYRLKEDQTQVSNISEVADGYIYVTYDVADNNIITKVDPTARVHQNGSATGAWVRNYEDWGQMFMIKFSGGDNFYQESGDSLQHTMKQAVYPYSNGDSGFNIYDESKWEGDKVSASTTRTRWSWYVLSENNDPYHVKITSWQGSHNRKQDGDDVNTSFYNYWRTYYNSDVGTGGSIVTATISDDPQVLDDSKTGGSASNTPTEYMLLGTTGHYKLVTTNEITAAGVDDHATYGKRRPVKDFLQYWKTYETISRKGVKPKNGEALPYDEFKDQSQNPYSFFSAENVTAHPVYSFGAWQNARPITPSDPTKSNSKKYEYANHFYQKITMGPEFDLVEHSIDGILVLLDNHGWEIMRKPMAKTGDATKASRDADISKFNSPMVKTYHFWSTGTKLTGYHKFTWSKEVGTGTSLTDYPEILNANGNINDVYVTYDVKPEYTELYSVTATKDGSGNITALTPTVAAGKTFLIRQDSKLAYDNSGTLTPDDDAAKITKIDTGQSLDGLADTYYWYLSPNWDIDKEMGYKYDVTQNIEGEAVAVTELETNASYYDDGKAGFDPYNIQIYNKSTSKYFTTNASSSSLDTYNAMAATFPNADPTANTVALAAHQAVNTSVNNGVGHDAVNLHMTNQTFMAVQDAYGNMRLMPRFDHYHAIENFTELKLLANDQPEDDKSHGQSTWLLRPPAHVYVVVDNEGYEALRYTALSDGAPTIPAKYRSPLAENFTFYKAATYNEETHKYTLDNSNLITGSFTENSVADEATIYVRYQYNPDADIDQLLYGTWYHAKLNGSDIKVITNNIDLDTYSDDVAHRVRFKKSAGDEPDPYAVTLWNGNNPQYTEGNRYIVFRHSNYTNENRSYALMQAGNTTDPTTKYYFLDGSSDPATIVEQSGYITSGTIGASKKLTLVEKVSKVNSVTFHLITKSGKEALTSETVAVDASTDLATVMPDWLKTPIMEDDAYIFYSAATEDPTGTFTVKGVPTTSPTTLDGSDVYVRYDYEKSKKAIYDFGILGTELPLNVAPLDLSGKVKYVLTIGGENDKSKHYEYGKRLEVANLNSTDYVNPTDIIITDNKLTSASCVWTITGNDPYECTIHNGDKIIAGKWWGNDHVVSADPSTDYPLAKLCTPEVASDNGYYSTFMVLRHNEQESANPGKLKLYFTGHDNLWLAESNAVGQAQLNTTSSTGGLYVFKDSESYKTRYNDEKGEPIRKDSKYKVFSRFTYRPVMTYHIITNSKKEALEGYSLLSDATVEMPEVYQSPLLNSSDFIYITKATETDGIYTVSSVSSDTIKAPASTTIASMVKEKIGDIYVRYTYDRDTSPFKIATNINDAAEDGTRLSWIDEKGLDLSGNTWYTIANMQWDMKNRHGAVLGTTTTSTSKFQKKNINALTNGRAPSDKEFLWRLWGNDPYAIKITNGYYGDTKFMTLGNNAQQILDSQEDDQSFMLLVAHANDNEIADWGYDDEGEPNYKLRRWTVLVATGTNRFIRSSTGNNDDTSGDLNSSGNWPFDNKNFDNYDVRMSSDEVVTRKIFSMGSGGTTEYCFEFVKAPVTRKYHYHAIKYDESGNKVGETWDAILEHDWLQKVVLEPIIARRFCKYEARNTEATGDNVTGTGNFQTQAYLEEDGRPNAQFYHDAALTERVKDTKSGNYDIYPEIDLDDVYDIYFKYQVDNDATLNLAGSAKKLSEFTSTTAQIAADAAHYNNLDYTDEEDKKIREANGRRLEPGYTQQAKWFYMVLDTDEGITTKVDGTTRTPVGRQLFLRREDDGTVSWMNNIYTLHKESVDNYKGWSYDRLAESYRKGENDAFREGRWLWTFVGDDPYNMRIINLESAVGVQAESSGVYSLAAADNCYVTISKGSTTSGDDTYPVTIPTEEPTENQYWGLCVGVNNSTEQTFSLLSTAITETLDKKKVSQPLYWHMVSHTANRVTTESVEGMLDYVPDRSYAIQLLPYVPQRYEDVKVVIRRDDEVEAYKTAYNAWLTANPSATDEDKRAKQTELLAAMTTGISKLYFSASERKYVAGDEINTSKEDALPLQVRRAFCNYTMYSDIFEHDNTIYTVQAGPYPDYSKPKTGQYDEDGHQIYAYYNVNSNGVFTGNEVTSGAQAIYVKYVVTSDIFLKTAPTKDEVATMAQNNDHVYFMDFPDQSGKATYHHAYYDPMSTMRSKTGDLKTQRDSKTGVARPEKRKWDSSTSAFVDDTDNWYNHYQYRTTNNRMESVPENLKWYFVGDPYRVQVYSTAGAWGSNNGYTASTAADAWSKVNGKAEAIVGANLARFNTVETNFQFVTDCVHLQIPDYSNIDTRPELTPYDENGTPLSGQEFPNRNKNKPYFNDFYWECVPTTSDEAGTFALRFKEDNDLLGYRNVYYYLAHDGLSKTYQQKNYSINLSYNADNEQHETGTYAGYHTANDVNTVIKLVQPVKVYVTANRQADERYTNQENVVKDELSEYYGLNETITEVPRHLQRKFVKYNDLTDKDGSTMSEHKLSITNATSSADCSAHTSDVFVTGTKIDPVFKFSVYYTVDDLSKDEAGNDAHLFSPTTSTLNWVDMAVLGNGTNWLFFDKTQADETQVSNYRTAIGDNTANGWNDGLKGLHWALVGDPYDFTILNRRRYEDGKNAEPQWLTVTKLPANTLKDIHDKDSTVWTTAMVTEAEKATYNAITSTDIAAAAKATHFSTQMWKLSPKNSNGTYQTGNADAYYFLRTSSLKTGDDDTNNNSGTNQTNNYWRMVAKNYSSTGSAPYTSYFEMVPYSLSEKNTYINTQYMENYSQTMNGLGVTQQRLEIRTAVAKDEDDADNNCFDADVEIRTLNGVLRLKKSDMEIRYGDVEAALPVSLRRYGCSYKCYLNYDAATNSGTEVTYFGELEGEDGYAELTAAMTAARTAHDADATKSPRPLLTYVYTVNDDVAQYFTSEQNARTEDYQWANSYFYWMQSYNTAGVEVERTKQVFDHYVYNSAGQIIDEVYREERYTEISKGGSEEYPTKGYLNMHSGTPVYADEIVQSKEDRQKWAMTGDPYGFTMKNYAQYLNESNAIVNVDNSGNVITQNYGDGQQFAYVVGKDGTPFLAVIDATGNITRLTDFEYSSTSDKNLYTVNGSGVNDNDPTGNTLTTNYRNNSGDWVTVKPFYLTNLMSYADIVQYHLVMAHQYSLDYSDDGLTNDIKTKLAADVDKRMLEFLMYWGIKDHAENGGKNYYISTFDANGTPTKYDTNKENDIKALLKEKGTLRNFYSYPVEDQEVDRIGVGNRPQLPWYMKRQFCTYYMYQRDVMRSVTTNFPAFQEADASWTGLTCTISIGQEYTDYNNNTYTFSAGEDFNTYYAGKTFKSNDGTNPIPMTFVENGVTKQAFNVKWESIFDKSHWAEVSATDLAATTETSARTAAGWEDVSGTWRKKPSGYDEALDLQGVILDKLYDCHQNRKVIIDVIYEVKPETFRFAQAGRNTTAWYQMMTNNYLADGLLNFSYKDGIGGRLDRTHHYTNNYLWAPEGDPYGFVLRSRYATINGTGWDDVAVTTEGKLPKGEDAYGNPIYKDGTGAISPYTEPTDDEHDDVKASYTGNSSSSRIPFNHKRIIHRRKGDKINPLGSDDDSNKAQTDGATNAVYEMFVGGYDGSFLMHPTAAWMDNSDVDHQSYYMVHETTSHEGYVAHRAYLEKFKADDLRYVADANWRLECSNEQLLPYFQRAGYVGGLRPAEAEKFTNQEYYNRLKNGDTFTFAELTALQNLVYGGKFFKSDGETEVSYTDPRPTGTDLPMKFVSNNLVTMTPGYYRIKAFSEDALNVDGADLVGNGSGIKGVTGPRYISGYRFNSAKTDTNDPKNKGGRWLHFFETDMEHSDIHTYADLKAKIQAAHDAGQTDRDLFNHPAMSGNIEILPADFDPSSIFQFIEDSGTESYTRYNIKTQGLTLWARPGSSEDDATAGNHDFGRTELVESTPSSAEGYTNEANPGGWDNKFRLEDIGGAATTIRVRQTTDANWDVMVAENLKTNYVCIDGKHRYRITCHKNNEMVEIGDHYTTDGINGIQDTKWLLQPVGMREEWPYNQMPLRVEVQQGGVRNQELTGSDLTDEANKDQYYYGSLYVPFDTRLANTTDAAFTLTNDATANTGHVTMQSLSQLNGMGNPQYVPAAWPVILRTNHPNSVKLMNQPVGEALATEYATRHYVNMYLPYSEPQTGLDDEKATIKLRGEYLERTLDDTYMRTKEGNNEYTLTGKSIMVFGIPFVDHVAGTDNDATHHEYDRDHKQVGWYTNDNWERENHSGYKAHAASYAAAGTTGTVATDAQRSNLYVYHNKVYYPYTLKPANPAPSLAPKHIVALFDETNIDDEPFFGDVTDDVPWPCDVYDLQGRKVAANETPATLLLNHPELAKGVYIFGGRKMIIK